MESFYEFRSKLVSSMFRAPPIGLEKGGSWLLVKGNFGKINFPIIFKQSHGKKMNDIIDTEYPSLYLIFERMKTLLEESKLTGWKTYLIKLYDKKENEISEYHGLSVTGCCGPLNYERSEIIEKSMIPNGRLCKFYKGLFIDNWDGSDFFTPEKNYGIFITKRAGEILKENNITNLELTNLLDYEIWIDNIKIFDRTQKRPS